MNTLMAGHIKLYLEANNVLLERLINLNNLIKPILHNVYNMPHYTDIVKVEIETSGIRVNYCYNKYTNSYSQFIPNRILLADDPKTEAELIKDEISALLKAKRESEQWKFWDKFI